MFFFKYLKSPPQYWACFWAFFKYKSIIFVYFLIFVGILQSSMTNILKKTRALIREAKLDAAFHQILQLTANSPQDISELSQIFTPSVTANVFYFKKNKKHLPKCLVK
jgi:hypothetical protein